MVNCCNATTYKRLALAGRKAAYAKNRVNLAMGNIGFSGEGSPAVAGLMVKPWLARGDAIAIDKILLDSTKQLSDAPPTKIAAALASAASSPPPEDARGRQFSEHRSRE